MKNEIKEILDKLQKVANRESASRNGLMEMKDKDYQLLLDYITNLQDENFILKSKIIKSIHLLNHIEEYDYRIFEENLENILNGDLK